MRLSFALTALAAFALAGATAVQADAPPAAPIFYCPTPGKAQPAPAATPTKAPTRAGHAIHAGAHRGQGCPVVQVAARHRHAHPHAAASVVASAATPKPHPAAQGDVSASQAFIYRYERALHGLDARAADQAWAEGRRPQPDHWRHAGPPAEGPALAQREVPPPPCPHGCPGPDAWRHDGAPPAHVYAQAPPLPPVEAPRIERRPAPPPEERMAPPPVERAPPPPPRAYAWQDDQDGYRHAERAQASERVQASERAGGWRYSEVDGRGQYQHWGDHFAGEPAWSDRDDGRWEDGRGDGYRPAPRYRCPPPVPASSCGAGPDAPVRHSDAAVAGRDQAGYLTWPGKTE
jgi:hypothetical protein